MIGMGDMGEGKLFGNLFLSIGAMKAGTTWLYAVLDRHPALHFTPEKEIHYFYHKYVDRSLLSEQRRLNEARNRYLTGFDPERANIDRVRQRIRWVSNYLDRTVDDLWYRNLFQLAGKEVYACDFSNLHAHLPPKAWRHILDNCDRLRVLYTLRDPVKRLWSHVKFHLKVIGKEELLGTWGPADFRSFARQPHIWDNAEYGRVLRTLGESLPAETWKAIFFEDLHADQLGTLRGIENFLDISPFDYPQSLLSKTLNESARVRMPEFFPDLFRDDIARIKAEVVAQGFVLPPAWT